MYTTQKLKGDADMLMFFKISIPITILAHPTEQLYHITLYGAKPSMDMNKRRSESMRDTPG